MKRYLTAQEVADQLGISVATVYAYVSRGLIRSEAGSDSSRKRRYYQEDVERLKQRQEQRYHPERVAEAALHFGAPLLESGLTLITDGRLFYRGMDALELARTQPLEVVAGLLWTGELAPLNLVPPVISPRCAALWDQVRDLTPFERFQTLLPLAALDDLSAYDLRPASMIHTGGRILQLLTAFAIERPVEQHRIAENLQAGWKPGDPMAAHIINMALVLCADHELNVSSFTARCVASAGSTLYAAVIGGLAALQGTRHGGNTERVMALFKEAGMPGNARAALVNHLKRGEILPGFGHRLYPDGDPRGKLLLKTVAELYPRSSAVALAEAIMQEVSTLTGQQPNIDFGLVAAAQALKLPQGAPIALFALGRTVGWIGHALEQYAADQLIRPRARYTGVQPVI